MNNNMKAIYQKPITEDIFESVSCMSSQSLPAQVEEGFNTNDTPTTGETSGNLSRRKSVWEDDEY